MKVITTALSPDVVPNVGDAGQMIGPDAFAIQSVWLPRDHEGLPCSWDLYTEMLSHVIQETLGGEFNAWQLNSVDIVPSHLVATTAQLRAAIRDYCKEAHGWIDLSEARVESALKVYHEFSLAFAAEFIASPQIVIQQSPPDLRSLSQLVTKSKELATPLAGMWIGMHAAQASGTSNPIIYLICVSGGIVLCGPSLALARELDTLVKVFTKKMQRRICPP